MKGIKGTLECRKRWERRWRACLPFGGEGQLNMATRVGWINGPLCHPQTVAVLAPSGQPDVPDVPDAWDKGIPGTRGTPGTSAI